MSIISASIKKETPAKWVVHIPMLDYEVESATKEEAISATLTLIEEMIDFNYGKGSGKKAKIRAGMIQKNSFLIVAEGPALLLLSSCKQDAKRDTNSPMFKPWEKIKNDIKDWLDKNGIS